MATTKVKLGDDLDSAINYVTQGSPHYDNQFIQGKRALMIGSVNGSSNPKIFKRENDLALKNNPRVHKNSTQCIRTIISYDPKQLDYRKLKDRRLGLKIGKRIAAKKYPNNESLIVEQADGEGHQLHVHIISNVRQIGTGKSSSPDATFRKTYPITDEVIRDFHMHPISGNPFARKHNQQQTTSIAPRKILSRNARVPYNKRNNPKYHTYSYMNDLRNRILTCLALPDSVDKTSFRRNLDKYGVHYKPLEKMRKNKQTGQYEFHFYYHKTPKGTYHKITPEYMNYLYRTDYRIAKNSHLKSHLGQYLRDKKHITFTFRDDSGKVRIARDSKLGKRYSFSSIHLDLAYNRSHVSTLSPEEVRREDKQAEITPNHINSTTGNTVSTPVQHRQDPIKALGIHKTKKTFPRYIYGTTSTHIGSIYRPYLHKMHIPEPVMTFQPKSHQLKKAVDDLTKVLNKIKDATADGSDIRKQQMEDAYEDSLLRKKQAEKVNKINELNRETYATVRHNNYLAKNAYYKQRAAYIKAYYKAERKAEYYRGMQW